MSAQFDGTRALREEIEGLSNVLTTLTAQTRQAEMRAAESAAQFDALTKLDAFVRGEIMRKRRVLEQMVTEQRK